MAGIGGACGRCRRQAVVVVAAAAGLSEVMLRRRRMMRGLVGRGRQIGVNVVQVYYVTCVRISMMLQFSSLHRRTK